MDNQNIVRQFLRAVFHELFRLKNLYNLVASVTLLSIMALGYFWRESYESVSAISVAQRNLTNGQVNSSGKADIERLTNLFDTRSFHENAINKLGSLLPEVLDNDEAKINYFLQHTAVHVEENNVLSIRFLSESPQLAHQSLRTLIGVLLDQAIPREKLDALARENETLIQQQSTLKNDLDEKARMLDSIKRESELINSARAKDRISSIRESVQDVEVNINAVNAKIDGIRRQLEKEEALQTARQRVEQLNAQKTSLETKISEARSAFSLNAPEVVSLQQELDNVKIEINQLTDNRLLPTEDTREAASLYQQLRKQLTLEEVEKDALLSRHESLRKILSAETRKASAGRTQAEEIEQLQKEVDEATQAYDQVVLSIEQNVATQQALTEKLPSYVVLDEPSYPQKYAGLGFVEFLIMGPLIAFGLPLGAASVIVLSDSRLRTSRKLKHVLPHSIPVLGVIPHYNSPKTLRVFRKAIFGLLTWGVFVFMVYITIGVIGLKS